MLEPKAVTVPLTVAIWAVPARLMLCSVGVFTVPAKRMVSAETSNPPLEAVMAATSLFRNSGFVGALLLALLAPKPSTM